MIWKTAWKNIWRNRVRSIVVISSVVVGIFAGVFAVAIMTGAVNQRVDSALNEEISHIQITAKDFRINDDPSLIINNSTEMVSEIEKTEGVENVCKRLIISGMANTATKSTGVHIVGINPDEEKKVFTLYKKIIEGTGDYFETESRYNLALVGQDLAIEYYKILYRQHSAEGTWRCRCSHENNRSAFSSFRQAFYIRKDFRKESQVDVFSQGGRKVRSFNKGESMVVSKQIAADSYFP